MTVAPFIVDTGMIQGSIIRFPGQYQKRSLLFKHYRAGYLLAVSMLYSVYAVSIILHEVNYLHSLSHVLLN